MVLLWTGWAEPVSRDSALCGIVILGFTTAAALVNDLLEARDDKRLLRVQKQLVKQD